MKTLPTNRITALIGAATGAAGALLAAAIVLSPDPLGHAIAAMLAASIAAALVGVALKDFSYGAGPIRRGPRQSAPPFRYPSGPVAVATFLAIDPTACAGDETAPDLALVASLTEARVQRRASESAPCEAVGT